MKCGRRQHRFCAILSVPQSHFVCVESQQRGLLVSRSGALQLGLVTTVRSQCNAYAREQKLDIEPLLAEESRTMLLLNRHPTHRAILDVSDADTLSVKAAREVERFLRYREGYKETPLLSLAALAREIGVGSIHLKDEGHRLGLGSFKALGGLCRDPAGAGGSNAVARPIRRCVRAANS